MSRRLLTFFVSSISYLWHAQTRSANGAPGATGPVSATANLAGILSESGLLGQVGGTLLGVPLTVGGGVVSAGLNLGSLQGNVVPTGVVQVGQEGASGVVAGNIEPTGAHLSASGGFTLGKCSFENRASDRLFDVFASPFISAGPLAGHASAQGGIGKYGPYFEGATLEGIIAGETIEIPLPSLGFSPPAAKAQATRTFQTVRARQTLN